MARTESSHSKTNWRKGQLIFGVGAGTRARLLSDLVFGLLAATLALDSDIAIGHDSKSGTLVLTGVNEEGGIEAATNLFWVGSF